MGSSVKDWQLPVPTRTQVREAEKRGKILAKKHWESIYIHRYKERKCKLCGKTKLLSEFYHSGPGYRTICKECDK